MCLILIYNSFFGPDEDFGFLPEDCRGHFTLDRSRFHEADAVVFHPPNLERIDNLAKPEGQLWVMWSRESSVNYPVQVDPAFRALFDFVMTYERGADIFDSYIPDRPSWQHAMTRPLPVKTASVPCVVFQSHFLSHSGRIAYLAELMKHIGVHSYGTILNNASVPGEDRGWRTKLEIVSRYKFCLAMENSICEDYVTEKLFDPLLCGSVPVYLGAPNVERYAPNDHAFINVRDFAGPKKLAEYLHYLDRDDTAYARYFEWRNKPLRTSLQADIDRKETPLVKLLDAVRERLSSVRAAGHPPVRLSFDPGTQGLAHGGVSVSSFLYIQDQQNQDQQNPSERPRGILSRVRDKAGRWLRASRTPSN